MKIVMVAPLIEAVPPLLYGGTERVVSTLTEELVRRGHVVTLFASGDSRTATRLVPCSERALLATPPLTLAAPLIIDRTGVGRGVFDLFKVAGMRPRGITITGGDSVSQDAADPLHTRVPKRDLAGCLVALVQGGRLKIADGLAEGPTLVNELLNFRVKINVATGNDTYEAWREGVHDDLVVAVAMAVWFGENKREARTTLFRADEPEERGGWRPLP